MKKIKIKKNKNEATGTVGVQIQLMFVTDKIPELCQRKSVRLELKRYLDIFYFFFFHKTELAR